MRTKTESIVTQARSLLPGGVNSPVRAFTGLQLTPMVVASGAGDCIWDVDGRKYIDYCGSWGALILGHAHPDIVHAAQAQIGQGSTFGISTAVEVELAERVIRHLPSLQKIRFVSSGTEATMTALRIARASTGRPKIVKFTGHYHGHCDALLVQAGSGASALPKATSKGILHSVILDTLCLPFNDEEALLTLFKSPQRHEIAAVIVEPIAANMGVVPATSRFLQTLRTLTARTGALLIFDEVVSGFRVGLQGAQGLYGITPDLTCLGKILGGGFPAAALGGHQKYMDLLAPIGEVYQAGTLSGNPVASQAGLAVLKHLEKDGVYKTLQQKADRLQHPIAETIRKEGICACMQSVGSMMTLFFGVERVEKKEDLRALDKERFAHLFRTLFEQGIYLPPSAEEAWFVSLAHTDEHLDQTADAVCRFIRGRSGEGGKAPLMSMRGELGLIR